MASVDLVFARAPLTGSPVHLVFGESDTVEAEFEVSIDGVLPALTGALLVAPLFEVVVEGVLPPLVGALSVAPVMDVTLVGTFPALTGTVAAMYISGAQRPTVGKTGAAWQVAEHGSTRTDGVHQQAAHAPARMESAWQEAAKASSDTAARHQDADRNLRPQRTASFQQANRRNPAPARARYQDGVPVRPSRATSFQKALRLGDDTTARHQDGWRDRRNWAAAGWQVATPHWVRHLTRAGAAVHGDLRWDAVYQLAMKPQAGTSGRPQPPDPDLCYTPPLGSAVHLLFKDPWTSSTDLVFVCENHGPGPGPGPALVTVPVKRVYVVLNTSSLRRVDGNIMLPTFSMSMSLDVDSWTWSFSASLPGRALADLQPAAPGQPVTLEVTVNGVVYGIQAEKFGLERTFESNGLKVSGRGLACVLDAPHAQVRSFVQEEERTAQQLMNDVLTDNGVSIGWDIDWQAVDWSVPAGLFVHQGVYISALKAIAESAGSYLQPHPTDQVLRVLPRYPALPWDWDALVPDFEIPSAVSTVEGIEWVNKALYNRVYVSGIREGVLGQLTRGGTDGGLVAPMITDALMSTAAAARQRGTATLADTGPQADVSLKMPVLAETGIIVPGKFVRYVDGAETRVGLTRKVTVDIGMPEIWQTITLETHVN